jgi:hypothetical protein
MDILKTNGTLLTSVADGTVDTSASPLALPGRNTAGYGQSLNQNLVKLLENFADITAPSNSILGQLWFNTDTNEVSVKTSTGFKPISIAHKTSITPTNPITGEMWWDTSVSQLKVWNGGHWSLVGPSFEYGWGQSGLFVEKVRDTAGIDHFVIKIMIGDAVRLIISQDSEFTPNTLISGFTAIKPGINVTRLLPNFRIRAAAEDSDNLGGVAADKFVRNDQDSVIDGQVTVDSLSVGDASLLVITQGSEQNLVIANTAADSYINFTANVSGVQTTVLSLSPSGEVLVTRGPTNSLALANKDYVDQLRSDINDTIYDANTGLLGYLTSNIAALSDRIDSYVAVIDNNSNGITDLNTALATKANIISPELLGTPTAPTPAIGTDNTVLATTEFVNASDQLVRTYIDEAVAGLQTSVTGDFSSSLALKSNINSPVFTGIPQVPTPADLTVDNLQIANTRWVRDLAQSTDSYWQGSRRYISNTDPNPGVNDSGSRNGDFWFKYQ